MARTIASFWPQDAQFPSTAFPQLLTVHTTERRMVLGYDAAAIESAMWEFLAPVGMLTPLTLSVRGIMASATSGAVRLRAEVEAVTPGDAMDLDAAAGYDTANDVTSATVPGTAGFEFATTITLTNNDGVAVGDRVRLRIARVGTDGGDSATGDFYLTGAELQDSGT